MSTTRDIVEQGSLPVSPVQMPLKWLLGLLQKSGVSRLEVTDDSGRVHVIGRQKQDAPVARVHILRPLALARASAGGLLGFADAYIDGDWDSPSLVDVTDWAMANEAALEGAFSGSWSSRLIHRLMHLLNNNSLRGSRRNISAHYDLGNDFYRLWLDRGMTYSSALFSSTDESLEQAQENKYQKVLDWLDVKHGQKVLEIGCGWAGFAEALSRKRKTRYQGITLSSEQLAYARERMSGKEGYAFDLTDYRDLTETYDRLASIEMIEAVGESHWPRYFGTLRESLNPGGIAVLQVITIDDTRFESYRKGADFIQRYIFPGGMLPSHGIMQEQLKSSGLLLEDSYSFGPDYARTVDIWHRAFLERWPQIEKLGFDERFRRMWSYYLAYCESGFMSGSIDVRLYRIRRP
ncbi:MAG: class I SAM-dependent methyltransferase [Endozoicomonas sp.]